MPDPTNISTIETHSCGPVSQLSPNQTFFGAIAAAGFGVLFKVGFRHLPWCAVSGALALMVRKTCEGLGLSLASAAFVAALAARTATT